MPIVFPILQKIDQNHPSSPERNASKAPKHPKSLYDARDQSNSPAKRAHALHPKLKLSKNSRIDHSPKRIPLFPSARACCVRALRKESRAPHANFTSASPLWRARLWRDSTKGRRARPPQQRFYIGISRIPGRKCARIKGGCKIFISAPCTRFESVRARLIEAKFWSLRAGTFKDAVLWKFL